MSRWRAVVEVLRSPTALAQTLVNDLAATAFPADCRLCNGPLLRVAMLPVCDACLSRVRATELTRCRRCSEALDLTLNMEDIRFQGETCRKCRLAPPDFARAVTFADYQRETRGLVHLLKFGRVQAVARKLGRPMAEAILQLEAGAASELLVMAVPLFRKRQQERGFNQSILLADEALRHLRRLRPNWRLVRDHAAIERTRRTETSYILSPKERRQNLRDAFRVTGDVRGREVLLIDDIYTSGATARECSRELMRAGAAKVWVATLARAQKQDIVRGQQDAEESVARWDFAPT